MDKKIIKRALFSALKEHLSEKEMTLLVGPRQSGKTTLLKLLEADLQSAGEPTLFLNLDIEADRQFFDSQEALVRHVRLTFGERRGFVFIDEAQQKEEAGRFFKGIYDMDLPYKFILSGSGSLELKEKIHESMAGRKRVFELLPVSFAEFAAFRTDYQYGDALVEYLAHDPVRTDTLFNEYIRFGGYPSVILAESADRKLAALNEIYQSYLIRDISFLLGVQKSDHFSRLVRLLASQIGNLVSVSELALTVGVSAQTIKQYLWYLEKTYIVHRVSPHFHNARKELAKMPVYYFYDSGLRNLAAGTLAAASSPDGFLFQNFVFTILYERIQSASENIHFWRSKSGAEVDFVIEQGTDLVPYEVKYAGGARVAIGKSLRSFIQHYRPKRSFIVTKNAHATATVDGTSVDTIPFYELLAKDSFGSPGPRSSQLKSGEN